ncbi:Mth938-like domain-containing protein [Paralimibaculum aggregatum]|uniref:Mth938-like domain-containing protein n=1 Tax=Paralimibaculum aggregatum TaxID=3036245 RepID=A0ABQ6LGX6_9RHOB|nr:Mth938-like domain-containing protein [Limibaculum sp. NKW23]GMG82257.1 Mth938-like domain-containing protein [Limibaculum sp. NKW23]
MRMHEMGFGAQRPIDSYGPGGFRIGGDWIAGSVLVSADGIAPAEGEITEPAIAPVLAMAAEIDVLLIGQGPEIAPLPGPVRRALEAAGIGVEIMSTPAACRAYNVLLAEERRVAALLIALS